MSRLEEGKIVSPSGPNGDMKCVENSALSDAAARASFSKFMSPVSKSSSGLSAETKMGDKLLATKTTALEQEGASYQVACSPPAEPCQQASTNSNTVLCQLSEPLVMQPNRVNSIPNMVLYEEHYVDAMKHIIERDYYPDLIWLRAHRRLHEAKLAKDPYAIQEARRQLLNIAPLTPRLLSATPAMNPMIPAPEKRSGNCSFSPAVTPLTLAPPQLQSPFDSESISLSGKRRRVTRGQDVTDGPESDGEAADNKSVMSFQSSRYSTSGRGGVPNQPHETQTTEVTLSDGRAHSLKLNMRLNDFHNLYTSEDNASFNTIMIEEKRRRRDKEWWIETEAHLHNLKNRETLQAINDGRTPKTLLFGDMEARTNLIFPAGTTDSIVMSLQTHGQAAYVAKQLNGKKEDKVISNRNTRLPRALQTSETMFALQMSKRDAAKEETATNHQMMAYVTEGNFDEPNSQIITSGMPGAAQAPRGGETPGHVPAGPVRGYNIVHTPKLIPGETVASPFITWGEVGATPLCLSGLEGDTSDLPGASFSIRDMPVKDALAHKLAESAAKKLRDKKRRHSEVSSPFAASNSSPFGTPNSIGLRTPLGSAGRHTGLSDHVLSLAHRSPLIRQIVNKQMTRRAEVAVGLTSLSCVPSRSRASTPVHSASGQRLSKRN